MIQQSSKLAVPKWLRHLVSTNNEGQPERIKLGPTVVEDPENKTHF